MLVKKPTNVWGNQQMLRNRPLRRNWRPVPQTQPQPTLLSAFGTPTFQRNPYISGKQQESQSKPGHKMVYPEPGFKNSEAGNIRSDFWLGTSLHLESISPCQPKSRSTNPRRSASRLRAARSGPRPAGPRLARPPAGPCTSRRPAGASEAPRLKVWPWLAKSKSVGPPVDM